jgi:DNA-binding PadR family transcriptional regulator
MKLPVKTRILEWAILADRPFTAKDLSKELQKEYRGERTASEKNIEKQLDAYGRVGFVKVEDLGFFENTEDLKITYRITEAGKNELKYIPGHGNRYF